MSKIEIYKGLKRMSYMDVAIDMNINMNIDRNVDYVQDVIYRFLAGRKIRQAVYEYLKTLKIVRNESNLTPEVKKRARVAREHRARRKSKNECRLNHWRLSEESKSLKRTKEKVEPKKVTNIEQERRNEIRVRIICNQLKKKYKKSSLSVPEIMFELGLSGREVGGIYLTNKLPDMTLESVARYYVEFIEGSE